MEKLAPRHVTKDTAASFLENRTLIKDWMRGIYTSEQINGEVAKMLGVKYDFLWKVFVKDCKSMSVDSNALNKIQELRKSFKAILITDNMDCFERFTVPSLGLKNYFDSIIVSSREKTLKNANGGVLFEEAVVQNGSIFGKSFLIDNSKESCEIFESLGGRSLPATTERPLLHWLHTLHLA